MQPKQLETLKKWFGTFVSKFYQEGDIFLNENIRLKECHTHRVCKEMRQLATALQMSVPDAVLAEAIALLHDAGRFPQFQKYRTYKDTISENHCLMALKVIEEQQMLDVVAADEREVIIKAVEFHGALRIPDGLDERTVFFTKMIRDVDKIDIFTLLVENYTILASDPQNFKWEIEFPNTPQCNPKIVDAVLNGRLVDYRDLQTVADAKLLQLGWVYDINFDYSLRQLYDRGYLQSIIDLLPKKKPFNQAAACIMDYVNKKIANN